MTTSSIRTEAILCNQCGARLQVAPGTNYADCSFCGCQLKIHRSGGAVFSETIAEIKQAQQRSDDRITVLELTAQLEKLEDAWARFESSTLAEADVRTLDLGKRSAKWLFGFILLFSAIFAGNLLATGKDPLTVIGVFGVFVAVSAIFMGLSSRVGNAKRSEYQRARDRYEKRKVAITSTIDRLQS